MESPLVILPAAGYGRRVGSPEAKELLPLRDGRALIEEPMLAAQESGWPAHLITRVEKQNLNQYCADNFPFAGRQMIQPTEEWPHTVLASKPFWRDWNLLVLPDTGYLPGPRTTWRKMMALADRTTQLVVAQHKVSDVECWGRVILNQDQVLLAEKTSDQPEATAAWGLILFSKPVGQLLFSSFIKSHHQKRSVLAMEIDPASVKTFELNQFQDLTRSNPIKSE